jgi:hypothetical protein
VADWLREVKSLHILHYDEKFNTLNIEENPDNFDIQEEFEKIENSNNDVYIQQNLERRKMNAMKKDYLYKMIDTNLNELLDEKSIEDLYLEIEEKNLTKDEIKEKLEELGLNEFYSDFYAEIINKKKEFRNNILNEKENFERVKVFVDDIKQNIENSYVSNAMKILKAIFEKQGMEEEYYNFSKNLIEAIENDNYDNFIENSLIEYKDIAKDLRDVLYTNKGLFVGSIKQAINKTDRLTILTQEEIKALREKLKEREFTATQNNTITQNKSSSFSR